MDLDAVAGVEGRVPAQLLALVAREDRLGRRMLDPFPMVPLAKNQGVGIALLSYDGAINFGVVGDFDLMWDLDDFADDLRESLAELATTAGVELSTPEHVQV